MTRPWPPSFPNNKVAITVPTTVSQTGGQVKPGTTIGQPNSPAVCPTDPSKPLLEPEALQDTNTASDDPAAKTAQQLTTGTGVKVAYIADAINPDNPDFIRADGSHVITDYKAFSADGPTPNEGGAEAYGDASSIAAQGLVAHDLSTFVNPAYPLPAGCNIRILGMAPGASIVALKIDFYTTSIIQAIDYASSTDHVDVINESFGGNAVPDLSTRTAIALFNDMAVKAGATVTVSSGDAGTTSTIGNPGTDPNVISVAANTNNRGYAQTGYAGARFFGNGKWINDQISSLSSGGFTQEGTTVDLTAPGESGWAVCDAGAPECANYRGGGSDFQLFGGTSQSAPLTAGAAALVISAYRSTHGGDSPSPAVVKQLLTSTATDLGLPAFEQGAGLLNSRAAVEAALTYPGAKTAAPAGVSSNIALSTNQLDFAGDPGSTQSATVGVTNVGTKPLTVATATRDFLTTSVNTVNTTIDSASAQTFPYPTTGAPWAYKKVTLPIPAGTDRHGAADDLAGRSQEGRYRHGHAGRADLAVRSVRHLRRQQPPAGWRGVGQLRQPRPAQAGRGQLDGSHLHPRRSFRLHGQRQHPHDQPADHPGRPGQPARPAVAAGSDARTSRCRSRCRRRWRHQLLGDGGQLGRSPDLDPGRGSYHRPAGGRGTFTGTITGGNARAGSAAQAFTYAFDVPKGKRDVSVGIRLATNPNYTAGGRAGRPQRREPGDRQQRATRRRSLHLVGTRGTDVADDVGQPDAGSLAGDPARGQPGSGYRVHGELHRHHRVQPVLGNHPGLPNSSKTTLKKGSTTTAHVTVNNTGIAPINVQVDPRTARWCRRQLVSPFGPQTFQLPAHAAPTFLVPPATNSADGDGGIGRSVHPGTDQRLAGHRRRR